VYASYLIRARLNHFTINPWYLDEYLRTGSGRKAMSPYNRTTAGQSNIGMEGLGQIRVPLPPLPLQQKFAHIVHNYERRRAQQRESARQAEHLFQSLLQRAFRGELTINY
jgi:type I restriction enzyme S subunit